MVEFYRTVLTFSVILSLLSTVLIGLTINIRRVEAIETIYIRADGSIEGTADIFTEDNISYTLIAAINEPIVVERSNIIIDGEEHTVSGARTGTGFTLTNISNVTIRNINIEDFTYGICLDESLNNYISGNNIANNNYGIAFWRWANHNMIAENNITASVECGIRLDQSSHNIISENNVTANNDAGIALHTFSENNTIFGNIITANNDAGIHLYASSHNNTISGNNVANNNWGILIWDSDNNTISGNNVTANNDGGIHLLGSNNNTVAGNNLTANRGSAIYQDESSLNNTISGNIGVSIPFWMGWWLWLVLAIVAGVVLIAGIYFLRKR